MEKKVVATAVFLFCFGMFLDSSYAGEAEKILDLGQVVVTSTKKKVAVLDVPASVTIMSSEDIKNSGFQSTSELIGHLPGVIDQSTSDVYKYDFRGTKSPDAPGPHILIDGREVNLGIFGFNIIGSIPVESIDRIEVIRTPGAYISGRDSSRGVINIVTKRGDSADKIFSPEIGYSYGSWNTHRESLSAAGKIGKGSYYINQAYKESDGYRNTNPIYRSVLSSFDYSLTDALALGVDVQYNKESRAYALGLKKWQLDAGYKRASEIPSSQTSSAYMQKQNTIRNEVIGSTVSLNYDKYPYRSGISFNLADYEEHYEIHTYDNSATSKKSNYEKDRTQNIYELKLFGERSFDLSDVMKDSIEAGYEYSYRDGDQKTVYPFDSSASARTKEAAANIDYDENYHALFLNNNFNYDRFSLGSGLRYEMSDYAMTSEKPATMNSNFNELGWNIAPSYMLFPEGNLYFNVGRSYFYPTAGYFFYAMDSGGTDNRPEDLKPEETTSYEIGFKHNFSKWLSYNVNFFYMKVANRFLSLYNDSGIWEGWKNVGDSTNKGVELAVEGKPLNWLGYDFSYSYISAKWDNGTLRIYDYGATPAADVARNMDITGKYVLNVPEQQCRVGLTYFTPIDGLRFNLGLSVRGESYIDAWNRYKNKPEYLTDAKIAYEKKNWTMYVSAENLFDKEYCYIANTFSQRNSDGSPNHSYYPKNGRYIEGGVSFKF